MFNCNSTKVSKLNQNLSSTNFPELFLTIKHSKLKFDNIEGVFKQILNENPGYRKNNPEADILAEEEDCIKKEIALKKEKIKYIKEKISELEIKQQKMKEILTIDVSEKDYILDLKSKCEKMGINNLSKS